MKPTIQLFFLKLLLSESQSNCMSQLFFIHCLAKVFWETRHKSGELRIKVPSISDKMLCSAFLM